MEIETPKGYEIDTFNKVSGVLTLKEIQKDITERVKTLSDAIKILGKEDREVKILLEMMSVSLVTDHLIAYQSLVVIIKALNEGWIADWDNMEQRKCNPYFEKSGDGIIYEDVEHTNIYSSNPLVLKDRRLAKYIGTQFLDIYKQWLIK